MKFNKKGEIMPDRIEKLKLPKITDPSQKRKCRPSYWYF